MQFRQQSFTTQYSARSRVLVNQVLISETTNPPPQSMAAGTAGCREYNAIWDTGATISSITKRVIDECNLSPIGIAEIEYGSGKERINLYLVDIQLPNRVIIPQVQVAHAKITTADVLIGMDLIGIGDFAVTNVNNQTAFSFRYPSCERIDFVNKPFKPKAHLAVPFGKRRR